MKEVAGAMSSPLNPVTASSLRGRKPWGSQITVLQVSPSLNTLTENTPQCLNSARPCFHPGFSSMYNLSLHGHLTHILSLSWWGASKAPGRGGTQHSLVESVCQSQEATCPSKQVLQVLGPSNKDKHGSCPKSFTDKQTGNVYTSAQWYDRKLRLGRDIPPQQILIQSQGKAVNSTFLETMLLAERELSTVKLSSQGQEQVLGLSMPVTITWTLNT